MPHAATAPPALAIERVSHAFGARRVLDQVSLEVASGELAVLLGPNGAGKTTLFALATRLYHSRHGRIAIFGHDLRRASGAALARIGVVFQLPTLDLDLSVDQNLAYHAALHGLSRRDARERIGEELARVDMSERRHHRVRELSAGQRRRVEVARALLHRPDLLLLDEPTVGLDPGSRRDLIERVRRLCREQHLAVLWATHLIDEAGADGTVIVLHRGRVVARDTAAGIAASAGAADLDQAFAKLTSEPLTGGQPLTAGEASTAENAT